MTGNEDGHSPKTCNYTACNAEADTPCPFVADEKPEQLKEPAVCEHEWRQYWLSLTYPSGFYCSVCLLRHD